MRLLECRSALGSDPESPTFLFTENELFDGRRMKKFWTNRIGLSFAAVGVVLMALTIAWRVNPLEGSVVPHFLTGNPAGMAALWVLLVTCMPVWIVAVWLGSLIPVPDRLQYPFACAAMLALQTTVYFLVGKVLSALIRKLKGSEQASNQGVQATR